MFSNGDSYQGPLFANRPHGRGIYYFATGACYEGDFRFGCPHGHGILVFPPIGVSFGMVGIDRIVCGFRRGRVCGPGEIRFRDGSAFSGDLMDVYLKSLGEARLLAYIFGGEPLAVDCPPGIRLTADGRLVLPDGHIREGRLRYPDGFSPRGQGIWTLIANDVAFGRIQLVIEHGVGTWR